MTLRILAVAIAFLLGAMCWGLLVAWAVPFILVPSLSVLGGLTIGAIGTLMCFRIYDRGQAWESK